ncbi:MAG: hypothetical protein NZ750_10600 [Anaerolineae bacterium]|nr:hypothetical protein [Anaerolineae bacterium]MDW8173863.1 hypothetical protein [Anaerolineae bacterium]
MAKPRPARQVCSETVRGLAVGLLALLLLSLSQAQALSNVLYRALLANDQAALARLWRERGATERALPHLERLPNSDPLSLRLLIHAYLSQSQWAWAEDALLRLHQLTPNDAWANFNLGALWAASDPARARPHLLALRRSALYREDAAALLDALNAPNRAEQVAQRLALRAHPLAEWAYSYAYAWDGQPRALALLGLLREQRGADGSRMIDQAARQATQDDPLIYYAQGVRWRNRQRYAESLEALQLAHALEANNPLYWAEVGLTLRLMGDGQAQAWIDGALRLAQAQGREAELRAILGQ